MTGSQKISYMRLVWAVVVSVGAIWLGANLPSTLPAATRGAIIVMMAFGVIISGLPKESTSSKSTATAPCDK